MTGWAERPRGRPRVCGAPWCPQQRRPLCLLWGGRRPLLWASSQWPVRSLHRPHLQMRKPRPRGSLTGPRSLHQSVAGLGFEPGSSAPEAPSLCVPPPPPTPSSLSSTKCFRVGAEPAVGLFNHRFSMKNMIFFRKID